MIAKLEKSELSIRLADKMDNMDRTWRWFINPFIRMCNSKVKDLFGTTLMRHILTYILNFELKCS